MTNSEDIFICPYCGEDIQRSYSVWDRIKKAGGEVNIGEVGIKSNIDIENNSIINKKFDCNRCLKKYFLLKNDIKLYLPHIRVSNSHLISLISQIKFVL